MDSYPAELESSLQFLKDKGIDYNNHIPDESRFSGEANEKYINDDKKIFSLKEEVKLSGNDEISQAIVAKDFIVIGLLKKSDSIILNEPLNGISYF